MEGISDNKGDETKYVKCCSGTGQTLNAIVKGIGHVLGRSTSGRDQ